MAPGLGTPAPRAMTRIMAARASGAGEPVAREYMGTMAAAIVYRFEGIGPELELVPLAGRRALDNAGAKVGLEAWRRLSRDARAAIVSMGSADVVDGDAVRRALLDAPWTPCSGRPEPDATTVPSELTAGLAAAGLPIERWPRLRGVDRWALASLASRGRAEALAQLVAELSG